MALRAAPPTACGLRSAQLRAQLVVDVFAEVEVTAYKTRADRQACDRAFAARRTGVFARVFDLGVGAVSRTAVFALDVCFRRCGDFSLKVRRFGDGFGPCLRGQWGAIATRS